MALVSNQITCADSIGFFSVTVRDDIGRSKVQMEKIDGLNYYEPYM